jgi:hypothetical protein
MSSNKLNNLKLNLLLKELNLLETEQEYVDQFIEYYKPLFTEEINKHQEEIPILTGESQSDRTDKIKKIEVSEEEEIKIKGLFRSIAKICHPDKTKDENLINTYSEAHRAYEENNLLKLYKIAKDLNIEVEIGQTNILLLQRIVDEKKQEIKVIESSYLWLWVNAKTEEEKMKIINQFLV